MYTQTLSALGVVALLGGCLPTYEPTPAQTTLPPAQNPGPEQTNTHLSSQPAPVRPGDPADGVSLWQDQGDPAMLAARAQQEGTIDVASRRHACQKVKFDTLGHLLQSRGVNMKDAGNTTSILPVDNNTNCNQFLPVGDVERNSYVANVSQEARYVYCSGRLSLGLPQYGARLAELTTPTTASSTKLFDLFASAAKELVQNLPTSPACLVDGKAAPLFNNDNTCNEAGLTCLQGYPATADQISLCNRVIQQAQATPDQTVTIKGIDVNGNLVSQRNMNVSGFGALETGKRLAVATLLSAAHSCE